MHKNNIHVRDLRSKEVTKVTRDGGAEIFNGIPDWVYEEEVFASNSALWWDNEGKYFAFLKANDTEVPVFPIQFYLSRPSGERPKKGLENYPETEYIKYPKAGAPNPVVEVKFYDVAKNQVFDVGVPGDFDNAERLVTEVIWADGGKVLIRETNRESDLLKMLFINVNERSGKIIRELDVNALDGGWFEVVSGQRSSIGILLTSCSHKIRNTFPPTHKTADPRMDTLTPSSTKVTITSHTLLLSIMPSPSSSPKATGKSSTHHPQSTSKTTSSILSALKSPPSSATSTTSSSTAPT